MAEIRIIYNRHNKTNELYQDDISDLELLNTLLESYLMMTAQFIRTHDCGAADCEINTHHFKIFNSIREKEKELGIT